MCHITRDGHIIAIRKNKQTKGYVAEVYKSEGEHAAISLVKELQMLDQSKLLNLETSLELLVVSLMSKRTFVLDLKLLEFIHIYQFELGNESPPYVHGRVVYCIPAKRNLLKFDYTDPKALLDLTVIKKDTKHPKLQTAEVKHKQFTPFYLGMMMLEEDKEFVMFKQSSIEIFKSAASVFLSDNIIQYKEIGRQKLTCCGIDISYVSTALHLL